MNAAEQWEQELKAETEKRRQLWINCAAIPNGQAVLREMEEGDYQRMQSQLHGFLETANSGSDAEKEEAREKIRAMLPRFTVLQNARERGPLQPGKVTRITHVE